MTEPTDRTAVVYGAIDAFQRTHRLPGLQHAQVRGLLAEHLARVLPLAVPAVPAPATDRATVTAADLAHALDNATPYPIELDGALCDFMAARLLEMLAVGKRPEHVVWQPEDEPELGEQPQPEDPDGLRRMADEAQQPEAEVMHGCPPDGSGLTPCCGRTPFELPLTDRISSEAPITCAAAAQQPKEA